jgi:hypothetical protein
MIEMMGNAITPPPSRWPRLLAWCQTDAGAASAPIRVAWACAFLAIVSYALVITLLPAGSPELILLDDLGSVVASAVATVLCLLAARRQSARRARLSWLLLGLGLACWALGDGYWGWSEIVLGVTPDVPSWADLGYCGMVILVLAGTALTPVVRTREISRIRLLLDATIILAAITAVAWSIVFGPLFKRLATDPLAQAVTLLYPLGSLGSLLLLTILMLRSSDAALSRRLLAIGWALIAAADISFVVSSAEETYATGNPADLCWFAGAVIIGLAAALDRPAPARPEAADEIGQRWQLVVPAVVLVLSRIVIWLQEPMTDGHWVRPEQVMLAIAATLLVTRIALGYRDAVLIRELYAQRTREQEASQLAQQEAARLQGVVLTGRELSHLLSNDLAMTVGWIDILRDHPDLPPDLREIVDDAVVGLERAVEHLKRLQQVNRVAVRETPLGPALDLAQSVALPDPAPAAALSS